MTVADPHRIRTALRRLRRVLWCGLASLLLVGALVVEGRSLLLFHTLTPWSSPDRIPLCGRDYDRGGVVPATAAERAAGPSPVQQLTRGPLWQPVFGQPAGRRQRAALGVPCAMVLYMREGDGYRSYVLSGGP